MAKISIKLDKRRKKKDETYPLKITVHRDGRTLYVPTKIYLHNEEWSESKQEVIKRPDKRVLNTIINGKVADMSTQLMRLQSEGRLRFVSDEQLIKKLTGVDADDAPHLFKDYLANFIEIIPNKRTREIYAATAKKIDEFAPGSRLTFEDITPSWLRAFDMFLMNNAPKVNARAIHLRNIRAIFNAALDDELISNYPFRRFKIKTQATAHRALTKEQFRQLVNVELDDWQRKYVDMFLLGFYLIGINVVDMAQLTSIENGRINYERAKTHKMYSIKVEPEAQAIIDKYRGKITMLSFFDNARNYKCVANRQNYNLKLVGEKLNISGLTYYCCRHTWATIASELDISDDVIAMALGHSRATVTDVYIRRNKQKIDDANRRVIDYVLYQN